MAFNGCINLNSIDVEEDNPYYEQKDGVLFNKGLTKLICYPNGKLSEQYSIPNSVSKIEDDAFRDCTSLKSISIPNSVTNIGSSAFHNCKSLNSIYIPNSVINIGNAAFYDCTSLNNINIPESVTNIGKYAYFGCKSLNSISIPNSVTNIGEYAFWGCSSLNSISIPNSVTNIGKNAFWGCTSLNSIIIPSAITGIDFSLDSPNLKEIICKAIAPPIINVSPFVKEEIYSICTLYVPDTSLEDYRCSKKEWSHFKNILPSSKYPIRKIYAEDGTEVTEDLLSLPPGIYIVKEGWKSRKIVII
jgi:hypothetical protein